MLPWQQNMLDQWDHYSVDQPDSLKRKALFLSLLIYGMLCLLFFIPHMQQSAAATVFIHGACAPVLFMDNGAGKGKQSARLKRAQKERKTAAQAAQKKLQQEKIKTPVAKVEPKKTEVPQRKSVVKEPKKKSKKELLAEKQKAQAAALKAKKAEAAKKAAAEKLAQEKKIKEQKLKEKKNAPKVPEKNEKKEIPVKAEEIQPEEGPQEIVIGQDLSDDALQGSGEGYASAHKSHIALGRAIMRVWRPPQVTITSPAKILSQVDETGKIKDAQFETKSGVVAYDIAARAAVLRAEFPKEFWGKSVTLVFGA